MHALEGFPPSTSDYRYELGDSLLRIGGVGQYKDGLIVLLVNYFKKQLSFHSDALNAFEGIFTAFRGSLATKYDFFHFWGIPIFQRKHSPRRHALLSFANGLCWCLDPPISETPNDHSRLEFEGQRPSFHHGRGRHSRLVVLARTELILRQWMELVNGNPGYP